jgi:endonuclease/exonuclease/phosphatase (EEP) superfamily protein YafD
LTFLALVSACLYAFRSQMKRGLLMFLLACGCGGHWAQVSFRHHEAADTTGSHTLFFWNIASKLVTPKTVAQLRNSQADVMGMVEAGDWQGTSEWYASEFPGYHFAHFRRALVIGSRTPILSHTSGGLGGFGKYALVKTTIGTDVVTILLVDVESNPFRSRRPAFDALARLIAAQGDEPLVVMGDFNTPGDSTLFEPLRESFQDAFETAGNGLISTWPVPVPVLTLDHIWLSRHLDVHQARHGWSATSDHRPVVAKVFVPGDARGSTGSQADRSTGKKKAVSE